ncbi:MAG: SRPBCC family protein [Rhodanobacteraceae bacterium]
MSAPADFVLVSNWQIAAPRDRVWEALKHPVEWPRWWPFVRSVVELDAGDEDGIGAHYDFHWSSRLPYSIRLLTTVTEMRKQEFISARAEGDLRGVGTWRLRERDGCTLVEYTWSVDLDRPWMRTLLPILRPAFAWNHNAVMAAGSAGLERYLANEARGAGR